MKTASISEAKNRLSAYLDMVRRGESILITDRGRPVARLAPLEPGSREQADSRLAELARLGIIRLPLKLPPKHLPKPIKLRKRLDVEQVVAEERGGY
jgi:prevent-host-death family protein